MVENRFFMSDDILIEFILKVLCKKLIIQCTIITCASLFFLILQIVEQNSFFIGVYAVNTIICATAGVLAPLNLFKSFKQDNLVKGYKDEIILTFDNDKISIKEGSYNIDIAYENIQAIHKLDKSCIFMISSKNGVIVKNDTFTKGNLDECLSLVEKIQR